MRAHTRPLHHDIDLNDVAGGDGYLFVRDGVGVAGRGVAARVPLADVAAVLAGIQHVDEVGGVRPAGQQPWIVRETTEAGSGWKGRVVWSCVFR